MNTDAINRRIEKAEAELAEAKRMLRKAEKAKKKKTLSVGPTEKNKGFSLRSDSGIFRPTRVDAAKNYHRAGNWYPTKMDASNAARLRTLTAEYWKVIAELNAKYDWKVDWSDHSQRKMYMVFSHIHGNITAWAAAEQGLDSRYYCCPSAINELRRRFAANEIKQIVTQTNCHTGRLAP